MPPLLHHIHLGHTTFASAAALQNLIVSRFLLSKSSAAVPAPPPTLLTSIFPPTYTLGRRETTLTREQHAHLRASGAAAVVPTLRGGQTTFHGPGQLTGYLILDLRSFSLTPRSYIPLLETSVIRVLERYGIRGFTTKNPGVWMSNAEKVCAVGVHMRRNITSYGIGLNVSTDLAWFDRIVACGLPGKRATNIVRYNSLASLWGTTLLWENEVAKALGIDAVRWGIATSYGGCAPQRRTLPDPEVGAGVEEILGDTGVQEWRAAEKVKGERVREWAVYDTWINRHK